MLSLVGNCTKVICNGQIFPFFPSVVFRKLYFREVQEHFCVNKLNLSILKSFPLLGSKLQISGIVNSETLENRLMESGYSENNDYNFNFPGTSTRDVTNVLLSQILNKLFFQSISHIFLQNLLPRTSTKELAVPIFVFQVIIYAKDFESSTCWLSVRSGASLDVQNE